MQHCIDGMKYRVETFSRIAAPLHWVVWENGDVMMGEAKEQYPAKEYTDVYAGPQSTHICTFRSGNMTMIECELEIINQLAAYYM